MKERMVPAQQLFDAGEDLVRLAAAKDAEIAYLRNSIGWEASVAYRAEIAALTKELDAMRVALRRILDPREVNVYGYKRIARDALDAVDAEAAQQELRDE